MRISDCSSDVCSSDLLNCPSLSYGSFPNFALSALSLETMPTTAVACRNCCCQSSSNCPRVFRRLLYDYELSFDRKGAVWGKRVSDSVDLGGRGIIKNKQQ